MNLPSITAVDGNKGINRSYVKVVEFSIAINLSSNRFQGKIPKLMGNLKVLADESNYLLGERRENLHGQDTLEKHALPKKPFRTENKQSQEQRNKRDSSVSPSKRTYYCRKRKDHMLTLLASPLIDIRL